MYYEAQEYSDAEDCFREAVKHGNGDAAYYLALMYYSGMGVDQSASKAILMMNKAYDNGCTLTPPAWYVGSVS